MTVGRLLAGRPGYEPAGVRSFGDKPFHRTSQSPAALHSTTDACRTSITELQPSYHRAGFVVKLEFHMVSWGCRARGGIPCRIVAESPWNRPFIPVAAFRKEEPNWLRARHGRKAARREPADRVQPATDAPTGPDPALPARVHPPAPLAVVPAARRDPQAALEAAATPARAADPVRGQVPAGEGPGAEPAGPEIPAAHVDPPERDPATTMNRG